MLKTKMTEMLGIEHPIMKGGMQGISKAELVAAVANAGAFGFLGALTQPTPRDLVAEVKRTRSLTDRPFGVNLTVLPSRTPPPYREYVKAIVDSGVKVVETAGYSPEKFMPFFDEAGVKVLHKCTAVKHALKAQSLGCAGVIIDGFEAAGHPGEDGVGSLVLLPRAVDQLDVPVVACGGFSDARGLVAALAMGAEAVSMGTRFMATREASIHEDLKQVLVEATELDTQLIFRRFRNTARVYRNSVAEKVAELESRPGAEFVDVADLVAGSKGAEVLKTGDLERGIFWAGLSSGLVYDVPTVAELVARIATEAEEIINGRLQGMSR